MVADDRTDPAFISIMAGTIDAVVYCHVDSGRSGLRLTSFNNSLVTFCTSSGCSFKWHIAQIKQTPVSCKCRLQNSFTVRFPNSERILKTKFAEVTIQTIVYKYI